MRILGIDPGTTIIGFGVVESTRNGFACIEYGVIRNPGKDRFEDMKNTAAVLGKIIKKHAPDAASVEKLFAFKNQKTVIPVAEMRGVIILTLSQRGLPIHEFTPLQVKQAVCNYGLADKKQVEKMVRLILKIDREIKPDDAADALAIALCCAGSVRPGAVD